MRLVIEREGGFSIVEDADAITEIDVRSDEVVLTIEVGGDKWTTSLPVSSHTEACRVSAAIAVKCGTLVEPLSEQSEVDGEAAMGAASAALVRERSRPWKPASEWVEGEPPRDGSTYVAREGVNSLCVRWDGKRWMAGGLPVVFGAGVEHRALGAGVAEGTGVSQWVEGEPPRDGRWYVVWSEAVGGFNLARWWSGPVCWTDPNGVEYAKGDIEAHLPTPIPER